MFNHQQRSPAVGRAIYPLLLNLFSSILILALFIGCKAKETAAPPAPIVEVAEAFSTSVPMSTEFIGQLDSPQNVEVRARVEAFVDKVLFTEGAEVKSGDPLFELDSKPFQEELAAAQGVLAEAKAALNKYEKDVARLTPLAQKRAIPQQDLDNAIASVEVGKANVLSAKARVESAKIDLSYCDMRAPISGLIGAKQVSVGELVGKGEPTLMATISMLDPIWFYCNISEVQYLRSENEARRTGFSIPDLPVSLIMGDGTMHAEKGKFVFIDRAVDAKTGTLRVRAEFPNPNKILRPGMFARIKVDLGTRPDSILVPERAVAELQGKNFVWIIDADNKATQRAVKVGQGIDGKLLILDGIKPGELFVVEGLQKVREGALVQPKTVEPKGQVSPQQSQTSKSEKE
jgi:membrane fusion protein (multidrug efflux system)